MIWLNRWWVWLIVGNTIICVYLGIIVQEPDARTHALTFLIPLDVGLIGICIGLDERKISKDRHKTINVYERPHIMHMLEVLFNELAKTTINVEKIGRDEGRHVDMLEYAYKRSQRHMETIRLLTLQFLDSGLSERHKELDHALVELGKVSFPGNSDSVSDVTKRLETIMDNVVQVIKDIRAMPEL